MRHCHACTILDQYDKLNAAGYCSYCVERGYDKRRIIAVTVSQAGQQQGRKPDDAPTLPQIQTLRLMAKYNDIADVALIQKTRVINVKGKIERLSRNAGFPVCIWKSTRNYKLTPEGEALLREFS